jgi:hypothetical protein
MVNQLDPRVSEQNPGAVDLTERKNQYALLLSNIDVLLKFTQSTECVACFVCLLQKFDHKQTTFSFNRGTYLPSNLSATK